MLPLLVVGVVKSRSCFQSEVPTFGKRSCIAIGESYSGQPTVVMVLFPSYFVSGVRDVPGDEVPCKTLKKPIPDSGLNGGESKLYLTGLNWISVTGEIQRNMVAESYIDSCVDGSGGECQSVYFDAVKLRL